MSREVFRVRCIEGEKRKDITVSAIMFGRRLFNLAYVDEIIVDTVLRHAIAIKGDWYSYYYDVDVQRLIELCHLHLH
ncbi:MAG: hypothetical protein RQ842_09660 [Vulcanisaeta sp.]|jgi:hypothetical protein|nr:hypothetical protein [Vulcanisaeta sp.]